MALAAVALGGLASVTLAREFHFCVRGSGAEFCRALVVRLVSDLEDQDIAAELAGRLTQRLLWESKAERTSVQVDDGQRCADAAGERVTLHADLQGLDRRGIIDELRAPGAAATPMLEAVASSRTQISRQMSGAARKMRCSR